MKKIVIYLFVCAVSLCCLGCQTEKAAVPLHQPVDTALKVEFYDHSIVYYEPELLLTLNDEEAVSFCLELQKLYATKRHPPSTHNEYLSCKIYYKNGDIDVIGTEGCFVFSENIYEGAHQGVNAYYQIPRELMRELFSFYIPKHKLPAKR